MKSFYYLLFTIFIFGCVTKEDNYLNKGLTELKNHRVVNEDLIDGITIKKFGIIKSEEKEDEYKLVFLLNNDVDKVTVESYRLGIKAYLNEEEAPINGEKKTKGFDFAPILFNYNNHNYIINKVATPIKKIDSFAFYLYDRDDYKGRTFGNRIIIKNIKLRN